MVDTKKFYDLLGVDQSCSETELKKAYRKKVRLDGRDRADRAGAPAAPRQEPQRGGSVQGRVPRYARSARAPLLTSAAYEVLSDPDKRRVYDQYGEEGLSGGGGGGPGGMDPQDLFSQLFGGGGGFFGGGGGGGRGGRPQGPRKGKDLVHRIKVSLEDLYKGKTTKLALQKHVLCTKCKGKGGKEGAVKSCQGCHGQGVKMILRQLGPMVQQIQQTCQDCNGEGEIINAKDRCKGCLGKKIVNERKVLEVFIDRGMKEGQTISFTGEADQSPGIEPGDVVIVIEEKPHEIFKRKGDDLYAEVSIDLLTALAGGQFALQHLDERALIVTIHPGDVIKPGTPSSSSSGFCTDGVSRIAQDFTEPGNALVPQPRYGRPHCPDQRHLPRDPRPRPPRPARVDPPFPTGTADVPQEHFVGRLGRACQCGRPTCALGWTRGCDGGGRGGCGTPGPVCQVRRGFRC